MTKAALAIILSLFLFTGVTRAQVIEPVDSIGESLLLRKEMAGSVFLTTLGYGVGFRYGINQSYFIKRILDFELLEMHAPNEARRYNPNFTDSRKYVYGKLNNLYMIRAGYGLQQMLNRKPYWGGIEVRAFAVGGALIGLAKPVYLYIADYTVQGDQTFYSVTTEKYDPAIHFPTRGLNPNRDCDIYGRGPFLKGFSEIKPYPGVYGKVGFNFEYGKYNAQISSIEVGATADFFPQGVPIMAFHDSYKFFLTGYISFSFGKRSN